jgi:hypothetical protein
MKNQHLLLTMIGLSCLHASDSVLFADTASSTTDHQIPVWTEQDRPFRLSISTGYRQDTYDYTLSIPSNAAGFAALETLAGPAPDDVRALLNPAGGRISPLSELRYDYQVAVLGAELARTLPGAFVVRASLSYGKIIDGEIEDSDYLGTNRAYEFSRSRDDVEGHTWDLGLALDREFALKESGFSIKPAINYTYRSARLDSVDGVQTLSRTLPAAALPLYGGGAIPSDLSGIYEFGDVGVPPRGHPLPRHPLRA